jgi:hypothetical protein
MNRPKGNRNSSTLQALTVLALALLIALILSGSARAQTYTVFYSFSGDDGQLPNADLIHDAAGNLYGTAPSGGGGGIYGVIFKLEPSGVLTNCTPSRDMTASNPTGDCSGIRRGIFTVLHSLAGQAN